MKLGKASVLYQVNTEMIAADGKNGVKIIVELC